MTTRTTPPKPPPHADRPAPPGRGSLLPRHVRLVAGWGLVALLTVDACWGGGIAFDLMYLLTRVVGLFTDDEVLSITTDWLGLFHHLAAAVLAVYLARVTLRYQRRSRGACPRCGDRTKPARDARWPVVAAWACVLPATAYGALKLHWAFGGKVGLVDETLFAGVRPWSPGMGDTAVMAAIAVALVLVMAYGRPRLSRWLLLPPAALGLSMLLPVGVVGGYQAVHTVLDGVDPEQFHGLAPWVALGVYPNFLLWGVLFALVTVYYYRRSRPACGRCGGA